MKHYFFAALAAFVSLFFINDLSAQQGVGIGATSNPPLEMLDVSGAIKIGTDINNSNAAPTGGAGTIRFRAGQFEGWDGTSWIPLGGGGGNSPFLVNNNLVQPDNTVVDLTTDDFIFGSPSLDDNTNTDNDGRFFYDKSKGAFRAGLVTGDQWNDIKRGNQSFAAGYDVTASGDYSMTLGEKSRATGLNAIALGRKAYAYGDYSFVWGNDAQATGEGSLALGLNAFATADYSIAAGYNVNATGQYSLAFGQQATASSSQAIALGSQVTASGSPSMAIGFNSTASNTKSVALGWNATSSGQQATAMGHDVTASGRYAMAWGVDLTASGYNAIAMGKETAALSSFEQVVGRANTLYTPSNTTGGWVGTDRLFTVGNGTGNFNRSNALTILKNGNTGIGTSTPSATLHVDGSLRIEDGNQSSGYVLTSDGSGNATWQAANTGSDNQNLTGATLTGTSLEIAIEDGTSATVDLSSLVDDADADATNEIQSLSLTGNTLAISGSNDVDLSGYVSTDNQNLTGATLTGTSLQIDIEGGNSTTVDLSSLVDDADADASNELQTLSQSGTDVTLSNGGGSISVADNDNDATNEYNTGATLNGTDLEITDGGGTQTVDLSSLSEGPFEVSSNLVQPNTAQVDLATDDFIFGSPSLDDNANTDNDGRFFYDKSKGAFRAGLVTGDQWDDFKRGNQSFAAGYDVTASGDYSMTLGEKSRATGLNAIALGRKAYAYGDYSFVWGNDAQATGEGSLAFGKNAFATADYSIAAGNNVNATGAASLAFGWDALASSSGAIALGDEVTASGSPSIAIGYNSNASNSRSAALGWNATSSGQQAMAMGHDATASARYAFAIGQDVTASGRSAFALGSETVAPSAYEHAIGRFNTIYTPASATTWQATDRLFTIGNGTAGGSRSDALVLLKNGNTGIGTSTPSATLHVDGSLQYVDGNQSAGFIPVSDANGTMTWTDPTTITTSADGDGDATNELQTLSVSGADVTLSDGGGTVTVDDGDWTVNANRVYNDNTVLVGIGLTNPSERLHVANGDVLFDRQTGGANTQRVLTIAGKLEGSVNPYVKIDFQNYDDNSGSVDYVGASIRSHNNGASDDGDLRFFTTSDQTLSEAMRIDHLGNVGVGTAAPGDELHVEGSIRMVDGNQQAGYIPVSDANGTMTWTDPTTVADGDWTVNGNDIYNANSGNVGIDITAPTDRLTIGGANADAYPALGLRSGNGASTFNDGSQIAFGYNGNATYQHFIQTRHNAAAQNNAIDFYVSDGTQNNTLTSGSTHVMSLNGGNVGVGITTPSDKLHVAGNIRMVDGNEAAGYIPVSDANGTMTWTDPSSISGIKELVDSDNDTKIQVEESTDEDIIRFDLGGTEHFTMNGSQLEVHNSGRSVRIGENAGPADDLSNNDNTFVGYETGLTVTTGYNNTAVGTRAFLTGNGYDNAAFGNWTLYSSTGVRNTALGSRAGQSIIGSENTIVGSFAGKDATGSGNVFLGHAAGQNEGGDDKLYIENTNSSSPLIYGEFDNDIVGVNGSLGVGTAAPSAKLDVSGSESTTHGRDAAIRLANTATGGDQWILRAGATGTQTPAGGFSIANSTGYRMVIGSNGNVGVGATNPQEKLHVAGSIRMVDGNEGVGKVAVSDANGTMSWSDPADRVVFAFDDTEQLVNGSGWQDVSNSTSSLNVNSGDVVAVSITFSAEIQGGSGADNLRFQVRALGSNGCTSVSGGRTDYLEVYREVRDHSVQTSIQHTFAATCDGDYSFLLQVNLDDTDDNVVVDDIQITAVKY